MTAEELLLNLTLELGIADHTGDMADSLLSAYQLLELEPPEQDEDGMGFDVDKLKARGAQYLHELDEEVEAVCDEGGEAAVRGSIDVIQLHLVMGAKLVDVEHVKAKDSPVSGAPEELFLHFDNSQEILIYLHDDGSIRVEGD